VLEMETRIIEFFSQPEALIIPSGFQVFCIALIWQNKWKDVSADMMKKEILELLRIYEMDEAFRKSVDGLVNSATTLNDLLNKIMKSGLAEARSGTPTVA